MIKCKGNSDSICSLDSRGIENLDRDILDKKDRVANHRGNSV